MYMHLILPVLDEWNRYNKEGITTKHSAQIALFYYHELTREDGRFPYGTNNDIKEKLIRTIFNGSAEIVDELKTIFDQVVADGHSSRDGIYYELAHAALADLANTGVIAQHLPKELLSLANLFWVYRPPNGEDAWYSRRHDIEMETHFDLASNHSDYYPASAFQTPIFALLRAEPKETIDFVLAFTNRSIEYFAKTELGRSEVEEIELRFDTGATVKQYICHRIWNLYRGTQVAPVLLESIHMALERWLLIFAKQAEPKLLEQWCLYLIRNSRPASITGIVASAVLAQPYKLFNVAKVLFRTRELFLFDTARLQLDMSARSTFAITHDPTRLFTNERLRTCDDEHRKNTLEHLALKYQVFRPDGEEEETAKERQEIIWKIFDDYYAQLPDRAHETDEDMTWRLYLARMDRREMKISTETKDEQVLISFNPEIDPELKKYSEEALAKSTEAMKYTPLKLWAHYRFDRNESEYKKYPQYDNDHRRVIDDVKAIIDGLNADKSEKGTFTLSYHSVPAYACAVLLRDGFDHLDPAEKDFCRDVILEFATMPISNGYNYQVRDGVDAATLVLPLLIAPFPSEAERIKETLLFALFDEHTVGMGQSVSDFSVSAIVDSMWKDYPLDANSLFLGYVLLKPKLDSIRKAIRDENYRKQQFQFSEAEVRRRFVASHKDDLKRIKNNTVTYDESPALGTLNERVLVTGVLLLPLARRLVGKGGHP
jgi:hypothetical protein